MTILKCFFLDGAGGGGRMVESVSHHYKPAV